MGLRLGVENAKSAMPAWRPSDPARLYVFPPCHSLPSVRPLIRDVAILSCGENAFRRPPLPGRISPRLAPRGTRGCGVRVRGHKLDDAHSSYKCALSCINLVKVSVLKRNGEFMVLRHVYLPDNGQVEVTRRVSVQPSGTPPPSRQTLGNLKRVYVQREHC